MAYELETIETKITENIFLAASEAMSVDVPEFLKELDIECSKIKKAFKHQVVSFENESLIKRYFHFHQESLIDLINNIQANGRLSGGDKLVEPIVTRLSSLLEYVEEHFPEYFDQDMRMPHGSLNAVEFELQSFISVVSEKFDGSNIDIGLVQLLKNTIEQFVSNSSQISFRKFYYLKYLKTELNQFRIDRETETIDLIRILIHCNFNVVSFYSYLVKYIQWAVNKVASVNEKLDELAFYLKFVNQEICDSSKAFISQTSPINIQLAEWISQEAQYLKHKQQLTPITISAEDAVPADVKLNFDLSVSVLAYLFRTFVENGVIQNKNTSELIRFLTKYVKTKRSESISYESLRIKYYTVENGTKDAVKKLLQTVLSFINKN